MASDLNRDEVLKEIGDRTKNIILVRGESESVKSEVIDHYLKQKKEIEENVNIISLDSEKEDFFKRLDDTLGIEKEPEYVYEENDLEESIVSLNGKENMTIITPNLSLKTNGVDVKYITVLDGVEKSYKPSDAMFGITREISKNLREGGVVVVDNPEHIITEDTLDAKKFIKYAAERKREAGDRFQFVGDLETFGPLIDGYRSIVTPIKRKKVSDISKGNVIVVEEEVPKKSIDIYKELSEGTNTLVVTPETRTWLDENGIITDSHMRLREGTDYKEGEFKIAELDGVARKNINGVLSVNGVLSGQKSVVYMTGINTIYNNGTVRTKAYSIIKSLMQSAQKNNNTLIISVDPTGLTPQQMKMLERDAIVVKKNERFGKIDQLTSELNDEKRLRALEEMSKKGSVILSVDNIDHASAKYADFLLKAVNVGARVIANYEQNSPVIEKMKGSTSTKTINVDYLDTPVAFDGGIKDRFEKYSLNDDERKVLEYASVFGMKFDVEMMLKFVGDDGEKDRIKQLKAKKSILSAVSSLKAAGLLKQIGEKDFEVDTHVRKAEYESIDKDVRAIMHEEIAWELDKDKSYDDIDVLVHHFNEAEKTVPVLDKLIGYASTLSDMSEDISVSDKYLDIALDSFGRKQEIMKKDYKELTAREIRVKASLAKKKQDILLVSGKTPEAVTYAEKSVREFTPLAITGKIDKGIIADFNFRIGKAKTSLGLYDEALVSYQNAAAIYEATGNNTGLAETYAGMGMSLLQAEKNDEAKRIINCAIESARKNRTAATRTVEVDIHIAECASALNNGNIDEALAKGNIALYDSRNIEGNDGVNRRINAHLMLAAVYQNKNDLNSVLVNYQNAAELSESHGYVKLAAKAREETGLAYGKLGKIDEAKRELKSSLKSYKRCGDEASIMRVESLL